jgi:putative molybdopterin biosynthesis protein
LALGREAFPINTGHLMPPGTDAVIMVENVPDPEADPITVEAPVFPWHNVRRVGEDLVAGEMVLPEGVEITPWAQGAMLAAGVMRVLVRPRPRVIIIPTGPELVPVRTWRPSPPPGVWWSSTPSSSRGWWKKPGGAGSLAHRPDDPARLTEVLKRAVAAGIW